MGVTEFVFELYALKAKIKGVFSRSYCCYGNLLCNTINGNLFPYDWAVCWYHDVGVNKYRVVIMTHQTLSLEKYWKLFSATLITSGQICNFHDPNLLFIVELRWPEVPPSGAPYPHRKLKETHELIFSWLSWVAALLVGAYARWRQRRQRSGTRQWPSSK